MAPTANATLLPRQIDMAALKNAVLNIYDDIPSTGESAHGIGVYTFVPEATWNYAGVDPGYRSQPEYIISYGLAGAGPIINGGSIIRVVRT